MEFVVVVVLFIGRGLTTGYSPFRGVLPTEKTEKPSKGLQSHLENISIHLEKEDNLHYASFT
jgi:hypothetical protein